VTYKAVADNTGLSLLV